ncbi:hypothetical protein EII34_07825 [Arachnia propionica]|uniref:Uncharacterized protein n=1 Tax=Arachnia propionica TaxID=1750 RepID=A0A3P1T713_9ACTN|nr:septum site-determining protein Ssd [Arachnia propionica]RRD05232.1 hypothetical protein EII34_07825 [Arachnia propionica]
MNGEQNTPPVLVSRDPTLIETIEATALALGVELRLVKGREQLREVWETTPLRLVGADQATRTAGLEATPGTWLVGFDSPELLRISAELCVPAILLPDHTPRLAEVLSTGGVVRSEALVVALVGASGGLGVSSLCVALATRAAETGSRTVTVELTPGGGLDLLFGAEGVGGMSWDDLHAARGEIGDLTGHLATVDQVQVLPRGRRPGRLPDRAAVESVLRALRRSHDMVVVDAGTGERVGWLGRQATTVLLVGADVSSVAAARAGEIRGAGVVVRSGRGRRLPGPAVAEALGLPLLGQLREDVRVPRLAAEGTSVGSRLARRLAKDARRLLGQVR